VSGADLLPADTSIGAVSLRVADLKRALGFYVELLDLEIVQQSENSAALAAKASEPVLVNLYEKPGIRRRPERTPGLYHYAILFPDRRDLGRTLLRLFERRVPFQGFADHGISEAAYLSDPDGNGIELAADKPRAQWQRHGDEVAMVSHVLNVTNLLRAVDGDPWIGQPAGTRIGHVHLHVTDLTAATAFYSDLFGFEVTNRGLPNAAFLAAGGYHHHIAVNTWAHGPRPADEEEMAGLIEFVVSVPDAAGREALSARLAAGAAPLEEDGAGFLTRDSDGNRIRVV
jgi:catechol 2,3-dioxygenase